MKPFLILLLALPLCAQKQEVAGTLSALLGGDRTSRAGAPFHLDPGYALGASYAHRFIESGRTSLYAGVELVANPQRTISSPNAFVTRDVATLYVTPHVMAKFRVSERFTPWALVGGGVSLYEQSEFVTGGNRNPASRDVTHGAFVYGGGVDVPVWRSVSLRGHIEDFYTGNPSYNVPVSGGQHNVLVGAALVYGWGK